MCLRFRVQQEQQRLQEDLQAVLVAASPSRARSSSRMKSQSRGRRSRRGPSGGDVDGEDEYEPPHYHVDAHAYLEDDVDPGMTTVRPLHSGSGSKARSRSHGPAQGSASRPGRVDRVMVRVCYEACVHWWIPIDSYRYSLSSLLDVVVGQ